MSLNTVKPKTLIVIEHLPAHMATFSAIAHEAARSNIVMRVIVPDTAQVGSWTNAPFAIHQTGNWTTAGLDATVRNIEATAEVVGIGTFVGCFTPDGLLGAQVSELCQRRGLAHIPVEALYRANNKYLMRRALHEAQVCSVRFARVTDQASLQATAHSVGFPLMLKPVVGAASRFISRCENLEDMQRAFERYRQHMEKSFYAKRFCTHEADGERFEPLQEMLAEEAVGGFELSVTCLCTEDQVLALMIHDKLNVLQTDRCSFEKLLITPPIRLEAYQQQEVLAYTREVVNAVGLKHCICHVELRYDTQGGASVIDVSPRTGGMRAWDSLRTLRGIRYERFYVQQMLGPPIVLPYLHEPNSYYGQVAFYPRKSGTLREVHGIEAACQLPGVLDITQHAEPGALLGEEDETVFAVDAWFVAGTPEEILELDRQVRSLVRIDIA
jgi:biotin carboxylase